MPEREPGIVVVGLSVAPRDLMAPSADMARSSARRCAHRVAAAHGGARRVLRLQRDPQRDPQPDAEVVAAVADAVGAVGIKEPELAYKKGFLLGIS